MKLIARDLLGVCLAGTLLMACSNTKFLTDDEILYTGIKKVKIIPQGEIENIKSIESDLYWLAYYKPNNSFYLPRRILPPIRLWNYNYMKTEKEKGFKSWIYRNFSESPVLISDLNLSQRARKLESELFNQGYFGAKVNYELQYRNSNEKKALVHYNVLLPQAYNYFSIDYIPNNTVFDTMVVESSNERSIQVGDPYNLQELINAQARMNGYIQDKGYYNFKKEYLEFLVDTGRGDYQIDIAARIKRNLPPEAFQEYFIGSIHVYLHAEAHDSLDLSALDTLSFNKVLFHYDKLFIEPKVVAKAIYFRQGDRYLPRKHKNTRTHLGNFGVFKQINIQYEISPLDSSKLGMHIFLSPIDKISLSAEANLVSKSSGFAGPAVEARLTDENLTGGGEKFNVSIKGGFEWQLGTENAENYLGPNSWEIGINFGLQFPKIFAPLGLSNLTNAYVPQTTVNAGFDLLNRVQYYKMNSYNASYGYMWKGSRFNQHQLSIPDLNIVQLIDTTAAFSEIFQTNPSVRRSFEEQTILSLRYRYSYDNHGKEDVKNNIAWESGFIVAAPFAKFLKITQDLRYDLSLRRKSSLVNRIYIGVGYPIEDQGIMPYVEQFFSGGANSVRGFRARSLGPGSFSGDTLDYYDQTGDIKLEYNIEYRYRIGDKLFGAVFLDIGNIWLKEDDLQRPGSQFAFNTFYKQLAIGSGFGLRLDFNFFVLRFDIGIPVRNPGYSVGEQWVFTNKGVRGANFYLAIGYPF